MPHTFKRYPGFSFIAKKRQILIPSEGPEYYNFQNGWSTDMLNSWFFFFFFFLDESSEPTVSALELQGGSHTRIGVHAV